MEVTRNKGFGGEQAKQMIIKVLQGIGFATAASADYFGLEKYGAAGHAPPNQWVHRQGGYSTHHDGAARAPTRHDNGTRSAPYKGKGGKGQQHPEPQYWHEHDPQQLWHDQQQIGWQQAPPPSFMTGFQPMPYQQLPNFAPPPVYNQPGAITVPLFHPPPPPEYAYQQRGGKGYGKGQQWWRANLPDEILSFNSVSSDNNMALTKGEVFLHCDWYLISYNGNPTLTNAFLTFIKSVFCFWIMHEMILFLMPLLIFDFAVFLRSSSLRIFLFCRRPRCDSLVFAEVAAILRVFFSVKRVCLFCAVLPVR
jgi:hypothetical protein